MGKRSGDMIFQTAGGRIPLTVLRRAAELAMARGGGRIRLGARQEITLCDVERESRDRIRRDLGGLLAEYHPRRPNIVTTRGVGGPSGRTPWLSDGAYEGILAQFVTRPAVAVSIGDPRQDQMPLHFGCVNFLASAEPSFWQASFLPQGQTRPVVLSTAIHSEAIAATTFLIQHALTRDNAADLPELQHAVERCLGGLARELPSSAMPDPVALNPIVGFQPEPGGERFSLGIPAAGTSLSGGFLVDLCVSARAASLATAVLTPWQTLLLSGIPQGARPQLERILVRHQVALGAVWDTAFLCDASLPIHRRDAADLLATLKRLAPCPGPLRIAVTACGTTLPDTAILVQAKQRLSRWPFRPEAHYSVYIRENFDRLSPMVIPVARALTARALPGVIMRCLTRYANDTAPPQELTHGMEPPRRHAGAPRHRCMECQTEYSAQYGDPLGGVDAGTPFDALPPDWHCPTCGAPSSKYITTREFAAIAG